MYNSDYNRIPEDREPIETEQFHVYEAEPPKQKKRKGAARFVALGLCCALIGGLVGGGGKMHKTLLTKYYSRDKFISEKEA